MDIVNRKSKPQNSFHTHIGDENKLRKKLFQRVWNLLNKKEKPNMLRQFVSKLSTIRPYSAVSAVQPIRFYSVQTNTDTKLEKTANAEEPETDILYKRLELEIRGHDPAVMRSYVHFATTAAEHLNIEVGKSWRPRSPYNVERYTVLKSAFVHKKHRVQYEFRTHFHFIHFHRLTGSTLSTFLEYIERNLPEGVALKVTKIEMLALSEHLQKPPPTVVSEQRE